MYVQVKNRGQSEEESKNRLQQLIQRTGYPIQQNNGQRIYGPHKRMQGLIPPKGSEIFVGKLPRFIFEDELVPLFENAGTIYQFRLMMDFTGKNRGYGFVTYTNSRDAECAVFTLNNFKLRNKYEICVYKSMDNCRLFIGGIPHEKDLREIWSKLEQYAQGIVNIIMYPSNMQGEHNRGYVFAEFDSHRKAALARRQLGAGMNIMLWENCAPIAVDWADPLPQVDPIVMQKVTKLYLRNVKVELTTGELQFYLSKHIPRGIVSRVHKMADFAFVHFFYRDHAEYAYKVLNGALIDGKPLEVSWARPRCYSKENRMQLPLQNFCSSVPPKMRRMIEQQKLRLSNPSLASRDDSSSSYGSSSPDSILRAFEELDLGPSPNNTFLLPP